MAPRSAILKLNHELVSDVQGVSLESSHFKILIYRFKILTDSQLIVFDKVLIYKCAVFIELCQFSLAIFSSISSGFPSRRACSLPISSSWAITDCGTSVFVDSNRIHCSHLHCNIFVNLWSDPPFVKPTSVASLLPGCIYA